MKPISTLGMLAVVLALAACSSSPPTRQASTAPKAGGYYLDDGPEAKPPGNLDQIPDAVPRNEPLHRYANRTYSVLGRTYTPHTTHRAHRQEGLASWYGRRFHGKKTASGELYDMNAMTAAHPTLPIPSYARVTALDNGRSVVVRINDRGPFHGKRIIDLSYAAAHKLDYIRKGSTRVRVESIAPSAYSQQGDASGAGVYLQVGAFARADNARQLRDRLTRELDLDADRISLVRTDSLHRVQLGPYPAEAAALADRSRVRERLDLNAVLVRRD